MFHTDENSDTNDIMLKEDRSHYLQNYIGGKLVDPNSELFIPTFNPATGEINAMVPNSDKLDIEDAVKAAKEAFPKWLATSPAKRASILNRIADLIKENLEELAQAESEDNGKPLSLAKSVDIPRAAVNFRFYASAITQFSTDAHPMPDGINYTLRKPLGVVACISPWNLPLYLFTWKVAPAIAAGNCVIAKPSEVTPKTAFLLSKICIEAGLPAGVLNIVHGLGNKAGAPMSSHPDIKAISFTGSTQTGKAIAAIAAPMFKKVSLEMGGKNPNIIFADCDYEKALNTSVNSSFKNQGQICLCGSRIFVEKSLYPQFKADFVEKVAKLKVGDPLEADSFMGAIVSKEHFEKVKSYIELAKEEGGNLLVGGNTLTPNERCAKGYFLEPTVFENLAFDCRTNQEEIFGPVVTITPFESEEEVLKYANSTEYGLSATIWTENLSKAHRVAEQIDSGIVWVNCWMKRDLRTPFGGMKNSGVGREGGWDALKFFTEQKNVCIEY